MDAQKRKGLGARERSVLFTLIMFSIAMVVVPISSYFFLKGTVFEGFFGYSNGANMAAIGTVIVVHILIGIYIWLAINEDNAENEEDKKQE